MIQEITAAKNANPSRLVKYQRVNEEAHL